MLHQQIMNRINIEQSPDSYRKRNNEQGFKSQESRTKIMAFLIFAPFFITTLLSAQTTSDSLSLSQIISQIVQSHPSIKEAEEALNVADAKIGLAKAAYLPYADASANYTRIYPVPEITFAGRTMQMAAANNYNAGININQTIYDFGKTSNEVLSEQKGKEITQLSVEQVKQRMAILATNTFYILVFLQDALQIKDEELKNLNDHLEYVQKKQQTGSGTQFEILTTMVRISNIESQKTDLETSHKVQLSVLNALLGQQGNLMVNVKKELTMKAPEIVTDSLIAYAINHRNEVLIAREKENLAQLKYNLTKAQNNPVINVFASGGVKDGYFPSLEEPRFNCAVGVGFKMPLFDGQRLKNSKNIAKSNIQNYGYETEIAKRNVSNEVIEAETSSAASMKKVKQFELQLSQAKHALSLAEVNYKAGVITNLDMLDATRAVSESQLLYLKSQIDYVASVYRLKAALGDRLY
jgi:outer membrane protein